MSHAADRLQELAATARSTDCRVPDRCGQYGWRYCETCSAFQDELDDLAVRLADDAEKAREWIDRVSEGSTEAGVAADAAIARAGAAEARADALQAALEEVQAVQPATLDWIRANGVIFDGPLGIDPSNWQHVAFSIYTDLCRADHIARAALDAAASPATATAVAPKDSDGGAAVREGNTE